MACVYHPPGDTVEIVGINARNRGRNCEQHTNSCGLAVLAEDVVVRLRKVQILNDNQVEESAIEAVWVTDGIDRCRVGFLPRHHLKHWKKYEGVLCQVIEIYNEKSDSPVKRQKFARNKGCAVAAIISAPTVNLDEKNRLNNPTNTAKRRAVEAPAAPAFNIVRSPRTPKRSKRAPSKNADSPPATTNANKTKDNNDSDDNESA